MKNSIFTKKHILRFFFEIMIIFIGLSLSLWVAEIKEQDDRKEQVIQNLSIIRNNIHQDTIAFDVEMIHLNEAVNIEYNFLYNNLALNDSTYTLLFEALNYRCLVEKNQAGYEMLMNMQVPKHFFKNPLNVKIIDFYDSDYSVLATAINIDNERLATITPQLLQLPIPSQFSLEKVDKELLTSLVYLDYNTKNDIRFQYILIMESARKILKELENKDIKEFKN